MTQRQITDWKKSEISPKLFTEYFVRSIWKINWGRMGLNINREFLNIFQLVDDILLISETSYELQEIPNDQKRESLK